MLRKLLCAKEAGHSSEGGGIVGFLILAMIGIAIAVAKTVIIGIGLLFGGFLVVAAVVGGTYSSYVDFKEREPESAIIKLAMVALVLLVARYLFLTYVYTGH